jgi:hypothetical protein
MMRIFRSRSRPDGLLREVLERTSAHTANAAGTPTDVQLLGQISGSRDWPLIREFWTRRSGLTGSWPARLAPGELALNLWPIPPGRLQLTTGVGASPQKRQPRKVLGTPALVCYDGNSPTATAEEALARAIHNWLTDVLAHNEYGNGLQLAPPILEVWAPKGRLESRSVVMFDLDWPIPSAEGVTWPPT